MSRRSDTEEFFHYTRLQREVQEMIAELAAQSRNNPSYKHIWQVYTRALEHERNQREVVHSLYDTLPQIHPELHTPDGQSQQLVNDRDAILMCQKASNTYESVHRLLRQCRQLAVNAASDSATDKDRDILRNQIISHLSEIDREANNTIYNGFASGGNAAKYLNNAKTSAGDPTSKSFQIQVGPYNTTNSQIKIDFANVTVTGLSHVTGVTKADLIGQGGNGLNASASPPEPLNSTFAPVLTQQLDRMMEYVTRYEAENGSQINALRSAQDKSREDIYSLAKSMEAALRQVSDYYRQMAQYYYAVCPKKDIPSGCN